MLSMRRVKILHIKFQGNCILLSIVNYSLYWNKLQKLPCVCINPLNFNLFYNFPKVNIRVLGTVIPDVTCNRDRWWHKIKDGCYWDRDKNLFTFNYFNSDFNRHGLRILSCVCLRNNVIKSQLKLPFNHFKLSWPAGVWNADNISYYGNNYCTHFSIIHELRMLIPVI